MVSNMPPFPSTQGNNSFFKTIKDNKFQSFWRMHTTSRTEGPEYYSDEFVNLVTGMLQVDPIHRFSISEIKQHPWYKGEVPSQIEIKENLDKRQQLVLNAGIIGGLEIPTDSLDPDSREQNISRGGDDSDVSIFSKIFFMYL
jgi:serine/threonine protein kinase